MAGKIFINYRRGDDPGNAGRLFDRLQDSFAPEQLFLDVDNIAPGLDFVRVLNERVAECDIVLAVIGKGWIDARDASGTKRLEDPDDFVRIEIASALSQGKRVVPVLVGDAPMPRAEDLPEPLRPLAIRNAVRLTHERFRSDTQGLIKALQRGLDEIEASRLAEAETRRRVQAEEERAFASAKRLGTVAALDDFLAAHGAGRFRDEARNLRGGLLAREEAFRRASASDDPAVPRSFLAAYATGVDADQVRSRLRRLEQPQGRTALSPAIVVPAALAVVLLGGAAIYWLEARSPAPAQSASTATPGTQPNVAVVPPGPTPDQAAWDSIKETTDEAALKRFTTQYPDSPLRKDALARIAALEAAQAAKPVPPSADAVTWSLLKETTDEAALKRFVAQYPNSPLIKDAQARVAALEQARAAQPIPPSPDQVSWQLLKETTDIAALQRFVTQYPSSPLINDAQARIASLQADAKAKADAAAKAEADLKAQQAALEAAREKLAAQAASAPPSAVPDPQVLTRLLQLELNRVGCFNGTVNGQFDDATKVALQNFTKLASLSIPDDVSSDTIKAIQGINKRVCPVQCATGQHANSLGDHCVADASPPKEAETDHPPARPANHPSAAPSRGGGKCFSFQGRQFCE
jgi:hypothetical protein